MDKIFQKQVDQKVEAYVDDILVCLAAKKDHLTDLEETLKELRQASLSLKEKKCAFEVREEHFLGYHITLEGIKPRMEKVEAVINMTPPKSIKEVQHLIGRVATLNKFLLRSIDKC